MNSKRQKTENTTGSNVVSENASGKVLAKYVEEWMGGNRKISQSNLEFLASCFNDEDLKGLQNQGVLKH
jgi:hypothetical protein